MDCFNLLAWGYTPEVGGYLDIVCMTSCPSSALPTWLPPYLGWVLLADYLCMNSRECIQKDRICICACWSEDEHGPQEDTEIHG